MLRNFRHLKEVDHRFLLPSFLSVSLNFFNSATTTKLLPPSPDTLLYVRWRVLSLVGGRLSVAPLSWNLDVGVPSLKTAVGFT